VSPADAHPSGQRITRLLASVIFGIALALAAPAGAAAATDFTWPTPVTVEKRVKFTAKDPDAVHFQWDLDEDGLYDDATGTTANRTFHSVRTYEVGLRALDSALSTIGEVRKDVKVSAPPPSANAPPDASFVYFPATPTAGSPVTFVSTSVDPDSAIPPSAERWDLNGDGLFDEAIGASATITYPVAGVYTVSLQVATNAKDVATLTLPVAAPSAGAPVRAFSLMSPFPIVRIAGRVRSKGARIRRLSVTAPPGTSVKVRCNGRGCPFKTSRHTVSMRASAGALLPPTRLTRVRRLERRTLRPGAILRVFVTRSDVIGKYTRFRIRKGKPPLRQDLCLIPGGVGPVSCPA
jgi:hypothetical protein